MKRAMSLLLSTAIIGGLLFGGESLRAFIAYLELFSAILLLPLCVLFLGVSAVNGERGAESLRKVCEWFWFGLIVLACTAWALVYAGYPKIAAFYFLAGSFSKVMLYTANRANKISAEDKNEVHP